MQGTVSIAPTGHRRGIDRLTDDRNGIPRLKARGSDHLGCGRKPCGDVRLAGPALIVVLLWRIGIRIGDGRKGARLEERGHVVSRGGGIAV